ncbi:MAG: ribonuclease P protein component [Vicingaceae bacterium]
MSFGLKKAERLYKRDEFTLLFQEGKKSTAFPIRLIYLLRDVEDSSDTTPIKCAFSVPKRIFKRAVDRNLLKRKMREAYRLNRLELKEELKNKNKQLLLTFVYTAKDVRLYSEIEDKITLLLRPLQGI